MSDKTPLEEDRKEIYNLKSDKVTVQIGQYFILLHEIGNIK